MQLLRDNLTLWTSDMQEDGADEIKEAASNKQDEEKWKPRYLELGFAFWFCDGFYFYF